MLPRSFRDRIWATYRRGQCDDMNPSADYCLAAKNVITWLARKEGIEPDTKLYDFFLRDQ